MNISNQIYVVCPEPTLKGDEDPRAIDDTSRVTRPSNPEEDHCEGVTSSSKLLETIPTDTDLEHSRQKSTKLGFDLGQPQHGRVTGQRFSIPEASGSKTLREVSSSPRRHTATRSLSDPAPKERRRGKDVSQESVDNEETRARVLKHHDSCGTSSVKHRAFLRSASQEERAPHESAVRDEQRLREEELQTRLQASEQRIQLRSEASQQARLHVAQQHQQYHIDYQQQLQQQQQQQQQLSQKQEKQQQYQLQQQQRKHQHSFSEPSATSASQQSQQKFHSHHSSHYQDNQPLSSYYPQQQQQQQQQPRQQSYTFQQKPQQKHQQQNQSSQQRRSHETTSSTLPERSYHQHYSGYSGSRQRPVPPSYTGHSSTTSAATLIPNSTSSHLNATSRLSSSGTNSLGPVGLEMGIKSMEVEDDSFVVETVEIIKRPGQTLGFYIREGNGYDRADGVFISRIQMGTVAQSNGLLHVGDEIVTVNNVKVGNMSLDDVVILMSIPKKLVLTIRTRRNSSKNKSCPALPMPEKQDPPIVVLKKGRSSSASALEMTEKCPDMYEPGQSYAQYPFQTGDYMLRRELRPDRQTQSASRYASIFITPQRAEAKLINDDGIDSSNSSDGSLPRSIDSGKDRSYLGQEVGDPPHSGYLSVTNPIYDHFSNIPERDYKHLFITDSIGRKSALPKSPSKQTPLGTASHMYRIRTGPDTSPSFSEPPYMNVGALREGLMQPQQQHYQPLYPHSQQPHLPLAPHHYQFQSQAQHPTYPLQTSPLGTTYPLLSQQYRGGLAISQEERRRQERLRNLLNSKSKYGRLLRSRSPECYNSDSELIFTHHQPSDGRGFASDYETYGGAFSDDEPVYSIPRIPTSSTSELEMLLKKFSTLSQELQQEQSNLQRQLSNREKSGGQYYGGGQLPLSRTESLSGEDYCCHPLSGQGSPVPVRRAASTQTPVLQSILSSHPNTDAIPFLYGSYPHEQHQDLLDRSVPGVGGGGGTKGGSLGMSIAGGLPISTSQSSMQPLMSSSRTASGRLRDLHLSRKPLHIPYSEFEPYKADIRKRVELTRTGGLDGLLSIHIMSGQGLKSSKTSLRDLYCVVAVDSLNKARTMIRTGAINFDWDEAFDIDLEDSKEASFLIYHWDATYKHRLCFHGSILLPGYVYSGHKRYVAIKLEPKGILFVTLMYKEPAVSLQRLPSVKKNALFGVDLETIIVRENSGLNVPLLVHKCVQEVERRGLETVGIYRLCGSARRKAMLRESFENNAQMVDLSAENVSDIHVVTGVLKDYLRELPEPLFTNALYQMLLDALSVRLPCDPEGSAKLMLSILECLPSANQDTMALLLNHLRRVAAHCDKNKMTIDNLAICFGPVLLCPAPSSTPDLAMDFKKHIEVLRYLLEIWDYEGSTSTVTSKSPTADTVVSADTGDSPQQASQHFQQSEKPGQSSHDIDSSAQERTMASSSKQ